MKPGDRYEHPTAAERAEVSRAVRAVADAWGGTVRSIEDGSDALELPVIAGLRRGLVVGRVTVDGEPPAGRLLFVVESVVFQVNRSAVSILLLAACGGLVSVLWPWFPRLMPAVPLGLVLAVGGWLLVAARLRGSGPAEFLAAVSDMLAAEESASGNDHG